MYSKISKDNQERITLDYLRSILDYEPETGRLIWRVSQPNGRPSAGDIAGYVGSRGYVCIKLKRKLYLAHRLVWFYVNGEWPEDQVDHKNGDPSDNRIENLRVATAAQNRVNAKLSKNNKIGLKGVHYSKLGWTAVIYKNYKPIVLGHFITPQEAKRAYDDAAEAMHGEFARSS